MYNPARVKKNPRPRKQSGNKFYRSTPGKRMWKKVAQSGAEGRSAVHGQCWEIKRNNRTAPRTAWWGTGMWGSMTHTMSSQASPQHPENRGRRHQPSWMDTPLTHGEDDDEPYISKEQMICRNSHCRNEADVVYRGLQLWDLEPCPKEETREMVTTKQHFRMIAQAMGTGHRAGNATRRNPAHCTGPGLVLSQK